MNQFTLHSKVKKAVYKVCHIMALVGFFYSTFIHPIQAYALSKESVELKEIRSQVYYLNELAEDISYENLPNEMHNTYDNNLSDDEYTYKPYTRGTDAITKEQNAAKEEMHLLYKADVAMGYIGTSLGIEDDPFDNLFKINLAESLDFNDKVYLEYDMKGFGHFTGLARSINDQPSLGGSVVQYSDDWKSQIELVKPELFHVGENTVFFNLKSEVDKTVLIRDVKLRVEKSTVKNIKENVSITDLYKINANQFYVRGYVASKKGAMGVLTLNNQDITIHTSGEFEKIISVDDLQQAKGLELLYTNGAIEYKNWVPVSKEISQVDKVFDIENRDAFSKFKVTKEEDFYLKSGDATFYLPAHSVEKEQAITVEKLRNIEVAPMGMSTVNITKDHVAYRFLPHRTKFDQMGTIGLSYDEKLLPKGYYEKDILVFFFDTDSKRWKPIVTDSIDVENKKIFALTNHFTDYIAGVIQVPESPDSDSYTPTTLNDIPAAHPGDKVNLIEMPNINQNGDAVLSYPIEIPAGRQGMQPNLSLQYNSSGGNGWMGVGWDLSVPSIEVNTKWGVPSYSATQETESYLLNGEEIVLRTSGENFYQPHRDNPIARISNGEFFPRIEGGFKRVERKGTLPSNYYWIVTEKNGTKYFYGNSANSKLTTGSSFTGNVGRWMLNRVEDANGNYAEYVYELKNFTSGTMSGGKQLYLKEINYTKHTTASTTAWYKVLFSRTTSPQGVGARQDNGINARLGFKEITNDVLNQIVVSMNDGTDKIIRKYNFIYKKGAFDKTLLHKIQQLDRSNVVFNTHELDYYNEIGNGDLFGSFVSVSAPADFDGLFNQLNASASSIGGGSSEFKEITGSLTFGIASVYIPSSLNPLSKNSTVGGNLSSSSSKSKSIVTLVEMNGDGLPDKLVHKNNKLYYRANTGDGFSNILTPVMGQNSFSKSQTKTKGAGLEGHFFAYFNTNKSWFSTDIPIFMEDVNNDGLMDIVNKKEVYFNSIGSDGIVRYTKNSSHTPNAIIKGQNVSGENLYEMPKTENPVYDVVRVWVAPRTGTVKISGQIIKPSGVAALRYSIEKGAETANTGNAVVLKALTNVVNATTTTSITSLAVTKGDRIFFRIIANKDYKQSRVDWNPKVEYTTSPTFKDPNGFLPYSSTASDAFLVAGDMPYVVSNNGDYTVNWNPFTVDNSTAIPAYSDEVTLVIKRYKLNDSGNPIAVGGGVPIEIYRKRIPLNASTNVASFYYNFTVSNVDEANEQTFQYIKAEIISDSNIDWKKISNQWMAKVTNSTINDTKNLVANMTVFNNELKMQGLVQNTGVSSYKIQHDFVLPQCAGCGQDYLYFVAKNKNGKIITESPTSTQVVKYRYKFTSGGVLQIVEKFNTALGVYIAIPYQPFTQIFHDDVTDLYFEYYTTNAYVAKSLKALTAVTVKKLAAYIGGGFDINTGTTVTTGGFFKAGNSQYGTLHQNWGQFAYNSLGKHYNNTLPINLKDLTLASIQQNADENTENMTEEEFSQCENEETYESYLACIENVKAQNGGDGSTVEEDSQMILLMPDKTNNRWQVHENLFINNLMMRPNTYMDEGEDLSDNENNGEGTDGVGGGDGIGPESNHSAKSIEKQFSGVSKSNSAGAFVVSGTKSSTKTTSSNNYRDINGDGYPDIIGAKIQITNTKGGLTDVLINKNMLQTSFAEGLGASAAYSGGAVITSATEPNGKSVNARHILSSNSNGVGYGVSAGFFTIDDYSDSAIVDLNGDGLADYLRAGGQVDMNIGGQFVPQSSWGIVDLNKGQTDVYSGGGGISLFNGSISAGFSISKNIAKGVTSLIDVNGDGLPDRIEDGNKVFLNTGTGFSGADYSLPVSHSNESESISGGVSANATYCIYVIVPLAFIGPKFCVSVGGNIGMGLNKETVQIMDFNGDGYPDVLKSNSEGSMQVAYSKVGKTNMLKQVKRPLGAVITMDYGRVNPDGETKIGTTYAMPFSKQVLKTAQIHDGYDGDGQSVMRRSFEYYNGYKDRRERSFLGFGKTVMNELDSQGNRYRIHTTEYVQNDMTAVQLYSPGKDSRLRQFYFKKGLVKSSYSMDAFGRKLAQTDYDYVFVNPVTFTGSNSTYQYSTTTGSLSSFPESNRVLPLVKKITTSQFEYNEGDGEDEPAEVLMKKTEVSFNKYSIFGNVTSYTDFGEVGTNEAIYVQMKYHHDPANYIVSVASEHKVTSQEQQRRSITEIDAKGNVTKIKQYLDATNFAEYKMTYDAYGNIVDKKNPGPATGIVNAGSYGVAITYDPKVNTFPIIIKNSYNAIKKLDYDYLMGVPYQTTDPFGVQLQYTYDSFGRLTMVSSNIHVMNKYILSNSYSNVATGTGLRYVVTDRANSAAKPQVQAQLGTPFATRYSSRFSDGLGRIVQEKTQLQRSEDCTGTTGYRFAVSGKTEYDEFGRVTKTSSPNELASCVGANAVIAQIALFTPPIMGSDTSVYHYDHRDREIYRQISGIGALYKTKYGHGKDCSERNQFSVTQIMPEGNTTISYIDGKGRTTSTQEIGENQTLCTVFTYGALGEILMVKDALDAETIYTYDNLGRKTSVNHPDRGIHNFKYDYANQLIQFDNRNLADAGQNIKYKYDFGRLVEVILPTHHVNYEYNLNRVIQQKDLSGIQQFTYGLFGELEKHKRFVNAPDGTVYSTEMNYAYDLWGRVLYVEYPDLERVFYTYDEGGMLKEVKSTEMDYIKKITYDHYGNRLKMVHGNDVETEYFYSHQQRLRVMTLRRPTQELFMQNRYSYDTNSNITKLQNEESLAMDLDVGGVSEWNYVYDDFNRLKGATSLWEGKREKHVYGLAMTYNNTHGIVAKNQQHTVENLYTNNVENLENYFTGSYSYQNSSKPHVVSKINYIKPTGNEVLNLDYDSNGNLTKESRQTNNGTIERTLYWDEQDRLSAVRDGNKTHHYVYDAAGERIIKSMGDSQNLVVNGAFVTGLSSVLDYILYPSGYVTLKKEKVTKHYYIDSQRIASRIEDENSMNALIVTDLGDDSATFASNVQNMMNSLGEVATEDSMIMPMATPEEDCEAELYDVKVMLDYLKNIDCLGKIISIEESDGACAAYQFFKENRYDCMDKYCETEIYRIKKILEDAKEEECLDKIRSIEKDEGACAAVKYFNESGCNKWECDQEYQDWLDYLALYNYHDCRKQLIKLVNDGKTKCEAIKIVKEEGCPYIIIRTEEECYTEFLEQYEYCLSKKDDDECLRYFEDLLSQERFTYCDLLQQIITGTFYVPDPKIPDAPDPVYPEPEIPVVEPETPIEEVDPVIPDEPVIPEQPHIPGTIWWYHSDHLGSSSYLTDINGIPTHYYGYLPFGELMVEHNNSNYDNVYKFNGKELDEQTGFYYYGARYYDPVTSIFLSVDPLAEQTMTPYQYVHNNPINLIDPTGMSAESFDQDPPKRDTSNDVILPLPSFPPEQGYPGQGLDEVITRGIQWLGSLITGSDVSEETSGNIQLATTLAVVIVSKGKNVKAASEAVESVVKVESKAVSSRAARREVMRQEGIPTSQQAKTQSKNSSGREYIYDVPKSGGGTQTKSVQQQTLDSSHLGQPHWEGGNVKTDNGAIRMNNYGRPKLNNNKSKVNY